jgi:HD-GYP domain-containing protein (c-di-GMP phosphodiesterase class II)
MVGLLGRHIGLDAAQLLRLEIAAALHDVGKIGIPDHILLKKSRLDAIEWQIMQQHAEAGEAIIAAIDAEGAKEVATAIRHHHEHFDGHGYPDGLTGESIPVCSRIIGIADSYDAIFTPRAYHPGLSHAEVMDTLERERGTKHDPWLLDRFNEIIGRSEYRIRSEQDNTP